MLSAQPPNFWDDGTDGAKADVYGATFHNFRPTNYYYAQTQRGHQVLVLV